MKKALLLGDLSSARYHSLAGVDDVIASIYDGLFRVDPTEDYAALTLDQLKEYDMVVSYADNWDGRASAQSTAALMTYVAGGGRVLGLHCGLIARERFELTLLFGARFAGHPSQALLDFEVAPDAHTISRDTEPFKLTEEPYRFDFDVFTPRCVLMSYAYAEERYPAAWCHPYGMGRVVCVAPGHSLESFYPPIRRLLYRAGLWLTDKL